MKTVAKMLKAIHAQENKTASRGKAKAVVVALHELKLGEAARKIGPEWKKPSLMPISPPSIH